MRTHTLAFIDTETTGFYPDRHEIIELGVVLARQIEKETGGQAVELLGEYEYKIKPTHIETADPESLRINGYDEADWIFALDLPNALTDFAKKTDGAIMVAHNLPFDLAFLEAAFKKTGVKNLMDFHRLDTISMAFARLYEKNEVKKFSLRALCEYFGIENKKAHSALSDAQALFEVYKKLLAL